MIISSTTSSQSCSRFKKSDIITRLLALLDVYRRANTPSTKNLVELGRELINRLAKRPVGVIKYSVVMAL